MSLSVLRSLPRQLTGNTGNPFFTGGRKKPASNNPTGLKWFYGRPQATDVLTHSQGYNTKVTSLIDGGQIFNNIDKLLKNAQKSVLLDFYELQNAQLQPHRTAPSGTPGADKQQKIVNHLVKLVKKGIKVKVVLDNSWDQYENEFHNQKMIDYLKTNGVDVVTYPRDAAKINHVKLLIVDGKYAVLGGMNWGNHSPANHDACVMLEGDDVGNVANQIFKIDYELSGGDVSTLPAFKSFPEEKIKVLTTAQKGSLDGGKNEILQEITRRIDSAQKSIVCELFSMTDKIVADKLIEAHRRLKQNNQPGVQILVDPGLYLQFKNCRPIINYLRDSGVPIRFYKVDWAKEEKLHAKWAVFDDQEVVVGSANWSKMGLESNAMRGKPGTIQHTFTKGNHEADLAILSPQIAKAFIKQFNFDWTYKSRPVQGPKTLYHTVPLNMRAQLHVDPFDDPLKQKTDLPGDGKIMA